MYSTRYSLTEEASDQSSSVVVRNRMNSGVGAGRLRSPGVTGEVLIRTSECTRSGKSSASNCANAPPAETPTTFAPDNP